MGSFGNYWENAVLDHLFDKGSYTPPTIYVALSTADPTEDGSGIAEPSGNNYSRVATQASDWNAAANGEITNATAITFNTASGGSWGTLTHFALFDDPTAGNMLVHGQLTAPQAIANSETAKIPAGDLSITLD